MKKIIIFFACIIGLACFIYCGKSNGFGDTGVESRHKIGVLSASDIRLLKVNAMITELDNYGYSKDTLDIVVKNAEGDKSRLNELARELVDEDVDIIVTTGVFETSSAQKFAESKNIPIIFIGVSCTVELGLINDKITPGCNITGVDSDYVRLTGKRLEFLKRIVPDTKRVLILYNPDAIPFGPSSKLFHEAADKLDIQLDMISAKNRDEMVEAIIENSQKCDGVILMCSLLYESTIKDIADTSLKYKIPVMGVDNVQVEKGILAFYGSTNYNEGIQAARLVANVFDGHDIKIIPIEKPEHLEFHINVDTAEALGIDIDYSGMTFVDKFVRNSDDSR
ncbi:MULTISPECIES: ABC transporter substrate-binding protein [unclassified Sedimentibacter]|uniref:ABC transporter substrate-binding protein n=1 Tax=unclassified Sedimentibacter TaxID=2649220 RepID=UPI0027DF4CC0|nr:ABC transporter substrate-binding protein [Sedimentibacter sp. MB35-C1]WMJ78266.1 ABC transporter substrate-binding protein [Sedimentibacter sp. MB35-C1]